MHSGDNKKTLEHIKLLSEIGQEITATLSVEEIIEKTYKNVNTLMNASNLGIGIFNEEKNCLEFPGSMEKEKKLPDYFFGLEDRIRPAVWCFENQREFFTNNFSQEYNKFFQNLNVPTPKAGDLNESVIYIPLTFKNKKIGVITAQEFKKDAYTNYHLDILRNLAIYVATALENALLYQNMENEVKKRTEKMEETNKELDKISDELIEKNRKLWNMNSQIFRQKEEIEKSYKDIQLLSEIGKEIISSLTVEVIIKKTYKHINDLMDASTLTIGIWNSENNCIDFPGSIEKGKKLNFHSYDLDDSKRFGVLCFNEQKEIFTNDVEGDYNKFFPNEQQPPPVAGEEVYSLIYLPLTLNDEKTGVITVQSFRKNAYTEYHLRLLRNIAVYISIALENARLYATLENEVQKRTSELLEQRNELQNTYKNIQIINEICKEISSSSSIEEMSERIHKNINVLMNASVFWIGLFNDKESRIEITDGREKNRKMPFASFLISDKNRPAVWCFGNQKEIFINDLVKEYNNYFPGHPIPRPVSGEQAESIIYLPLTVKNMKIGVVTVQSFKKNVYSETHLNMLRILAEIIACTIGNPDFPKKNSE